MTFFKPQLPSLLSIYLVHMSLVDENLDKVEEVEEDDEVMDLEEAVDLARQRAEEA